ncbi:triose-phosphate isomerase [Atribacter laminatus]|uniref:Triosephosphate isomerase n=1 Tax=Atribacter laminatus TaxID=2847778 RepID=A0A7T1ANM3_ATRLM|nr:triose-phosphate isomerase [Atribacter laminatus]QPM69238.1 Triosephosphate isomerase [Atribacter laminatus]
MSRIPIAAGNWKMNKTVEEASEFAEALLDLSPNTSDIEVILCPPFVTLYPLSQKLAQKGIKLAAQNCYWEAKGAFTGEVSIPMLLAAHCQYVICGHSERRHIFGETSEDVGKKVTAAIHFGLKPILCVGETIEEREAGRTETIVFDHLSKGITNLSKEEALSLVVAYEPVWAIGTGKAATPQDAHQVISYIRQQLVKKFGDNTAKQIRILYGGSVTPDNVFDFMKDPDIDGSLVGGASLDPTKFYKIILESLRASQ